MNHNSIVGLWVQISTFVIDSRKLSTATFIHWGLMDRTSGYAVCQSESVTRHIKVRLTRVNCGNMLILAQLMQIETEWNYSPGLRSVRKSNPIEKGKILEYQQGSRFGNSIAIVRSPPKWSFFNYASCQNGKPRQKIELTAMRQPLSGCGITLVDSLCSSPETPAPALNSLKRFPAAAHLQWKPKRNHTTVHRHKTIASRRNGPGPVGN